MPKEINTRIQNKHDLEVNWQKATTFIPMQGELIIYDKDSTHNYERFKIGDGTSTVTALPFADEALEEKLSNQDAVVLAEAQAYTKTHIDDTTAHITSVERTNWNAAKTHASSAHAPSDAEKNVQSDWSVTDTTSDAYIKNKPTIPTVNNGTLTIQKNGTTVKTFTANSSTNVTANITVPTKVSELTNDSNFISSYTETDPTVPAWAKASSKPSYNLGEISDTTDYVRMTDDERTKLSGIAAGAEVNVQSDWNATSGDAFIKNKPTLATVATSGSYNDLANKPTIPSIEGLATETYVDNKVASLVDSSPDALNTLNELAAALGDDPNFATTVSTNIGKKVDKTTTVNGHALSGNVTVSKSDVGLGSVVNTGDSATPISGGTTKFTTGGAYTELAKKVDKTTTINGHALSSNISLTYSDVDAAASSHAHGNITNAGALGTANAVVVTDANKKITTAAFTYAYDSATNTVTFS